MKLQRTCLLALPLGALACMSTDESSEGAAEDGARSEAASAAVAELPARPFGETADGQAATAWTLRNRRGMEAVITDFGATLVSLRVPDRDGRFDDVVLGFDDVSGYQGEGNQYFGCSVGRVANRIAKGRFELDGQSFELATNNDVNHLHGGDVGFGARMWRRVPSRTPGSLTFELVSADGDEGYPGRLEATASYTLTDDNVLVFGFGARADRATPVSLTNHAYWNLAGHGADTVLDHELLIAADAYTPMDATMIPTGEVLAPPSALDFRVQKPIGRDIAAVIDSPALGYDHNYALPAVRGVRSLEARMASGAPDARLEHPASGRAMELYTDQPGLQFYSGNYLFGQSGKDGATYPLRSACCLEPQGFPDAVNHPGFPSVILQPGSTYSHTTALRFLVD